MWASARQAHEEVSMIYTPTDNILAVEIPPASSLTPVVPSFLRTPPRMSRDGDAQGEAVDAAADDVEESTPPPLSRATMEALSFLDDEDAPDAGKTVAVAPLAEDGAEALVRRFEAERKLSIGMGVSALFGGFARVDWLDAADPSDLPAAADEIVLAQAARLVIRASARVENVWRTRVLRHRDTCPLDGVTRDILQERAQAVSYYLELRERQARIAHVESLNREKGTAGARRRRPAKPALRTPTTKKG